MQDVQVGDLTGFPRAPTFCFLTTIPVRGMTIAGYSLHAIETGSFGLDGGAMFGVVPRVLWEKSNPPDLRNRIAMAARALLLKGINRVVLIDTGNGSKWEPKLASIYNIDSSTHDLVRSLKLFGVTPAEVTDVILTHLHFDHAGGATSRQNGECVPTFPNARYYVQREHWEAAHHPTERDKASFFEDDFAPLHQAGVLTFTEGEAEIVPGVRVEIVHGHTTALQCPVISDATHTLFYCADLVPTASHIPLPWIMAYDLRPLVTLEEKRRLMRRAVDGKWLLFLEHDPTIALAKVMEDGKGFKLAAPVVFDGD
jgi:glyoxylase-like metal-dependent hydrolase (beta-lactamase superfamily II)